MTAIQIIGYSIALAGASHLLRTFVVVLPKLTIPSPSPLFCYSQAWLSSRLRPNKWQSTWRRREHSWADRTKRQFLGGADKYLLTKIWKNVTTPCCVSYFQQSCPTSCPASGDNIGRSHACPSALTAKSPSHALRGCLGSSWPKTPYPGLNC